MSNNKGHFSGGMVHPFFKKRRLKKVPAFWASELGEHVVLIWIVFKLQSSQVEKRDSHIHTLDTE
jgi:hypothetical protein